MVRACAHDKTVYMNAWLKRCVFNLDLNRESVSEPERYQEGYSRVWETNMKKLYNDSEDINNVAKYISNKYYPF